MGCQAIVSRARSDQEEYVREEGVSPSNKGAKSSGYGEELGLRTPFCRGNHQDPIWKAGEAQVQTVALRWGLPAAEPRPQGRGGQG